MGKLLLVSVILLSASMSKCDQPKHDKSTPNENQAKDSVHIHKSPKQQKIDSVKQAKTQQKLKNRKDMSE